MNRYTITFALVLYAIVAYQIGWTGEYAAAPHVSRPADAADMKK